jgi:predicted permease
VRTLQPFRLAWRSLRRTPVFTTAAVLTLAVGIGAAAAIFAVVNGILLRPLPYGHPEQLVGVWNDLPPLSLQHAGQTSATYFTFKRFAKSVSAIAAYTDGSVAVTEPGGVTEPRRVAAGYITANLIPLLQVSPEIGRSFTDEEDRPHGPPAVIISDAVWRARFGGAATVLGQTLQVNGVAHRIVGVMPARFRFPDAGTELWFPLALDPANPFPGGFNYNAVARLRPGVSPAAAEREFRAVLPRVVDVSPMMEPNVSTQMLLDQARPQPVVTPMRADVVGGIAATLWVVAATAGLLLLVACANVANLILVRTDARQRELAVRAALGAGRARVLRHFVTESMVLAACAGTLGLVIAAVGVRALVHAGPSELPRLADVRVDGWVVLFTLVVTALVTVACSAIPAMRVARAEVASVLREGGRGGTAGRARHRVRGALVAAQIALAVVVLAGSGLLLRSFERLHAVRPGWNPDHLTTLWVSLPDSRYPGDSAVARFYSQLTTRAADLPGVRSVGLASRIPLASHGENSSPIWVEGDASAALRIPPLQLFITTDGGFFHAMGIPLLAGRTFLPIDGEQHSDEAIVNRATAEHFWHDSTGRRALGRRFQALPHGPWYTVVGVVASAHDSSLQTPPSPTVYFPEVPGRDTASAQLARTMALVVRTSGDPAAVIKPIQGIVRAMDPALPLFDISTMTGLVHASLARLSFTMLVIGVAAIITLLLGTIGLYGVVAYIVSLRTRELGVRIALGATPDLIGRMVTRQGLTFTLAGLLLGLALFALVAHFIRSLLFGVAPSDPVTLIVVSLVLILVALLASWIPARRAAHTDPMEALRAE